MYKQKQSQNPSQRQKPTAHLAQTMTLLGMNADELRQRIEAELATNPALELVKEKVCSTCHRPVPEDGHCIFCTSAGNSTEDEPLVFVSSRDDFNFPGRSFESDIPEDEYSAASQNLPEFVLHQIATEIEVEDRLIVAHILSSLNEDGLLDVPLIEIASYHHVPLSKIRELVRTIQLCDPLGVGSPSPQDALLIQLEVLGTTKSAPDLAYKAVAEGFHYLTQRQYGDLAKFLGTTPKKVKEIATFVRDYLNPYPGRAHWGNVQHRSKPTQSVYHQPDVIITKAKHQNGGQLVIEVLLPIGGGLQVDPVFRKAIREAPSQKEDEWRADIDSASLLIKCLRQRNHTMVRLMQYLANNQREFILQGCAHLKPITRVKLAEELGVHESTISRAVSNKSLQLPSGKIIPIAKFFDRSLPIRTAVREIIEAETKPLSDTKIVAFLAERGYHVARRTVAKYRAMEGILPAHLRAKRV